MKNIFYLLAILLALQVKAQDLETATKLTNSTFDEDFYVMSVDLDGTSSPYMTKSSYILPWRVTSNGVYLQLSNMNLCLGCLSSEAATNSSTLRVSGTSSFYGNSYFTSNLYLGTSNYLTYSGSDMMFYDLSNPSGVSLSELATSSASYTASNGLTLSGTNFTLEGTIIDGYNQIITLGSNSRFSFTDSEGDIGISINNSYQNRIEITAGLLYNYVDDWATISDDITMGYSSSLDMLYVNDSRVSKKGLQYYNHFDNSAIPTGIPDVATVQAMIDAGMDSLYTDDFTLYEYSDYYLGVRNNNIPGYEPFGLYSTTDRFGIGNLTGNSYVQVNPSDYVRLYINGSSLDWDGDSLYTTTDRLAWKSEITNGTPGGSPGAIQANIAGAFGASGLTTDGTDITLPSGSTFIHTQEVEDTSFIIINNNESPSIYIENNDLGGAIKIVNTDQNGAGIFVSDISGAKSGATSIRVDKEGLTIFSVRDDSTTRIHKLEVGGGAPIDSTISYTDLPVYIGQLYIDASNTVAVGVADTYYTVDDWTTDLTQNTTLVDSSITVTVAGYYEVSNSLSYTHGTNNTIVHHSIFVNDIEATEIETQRKIGTGGDIGNSGNSGVLLLSANDVVKVKMKADNTGTITISHANFHLIRL